MPGQVHHRYAIVDGHRIFYREAGDPGAPAIVLLHGVPHQLVHVPRPDPTRLADRYHLIAPDHLGFGLSDAPQVEEFAYSFDALTDLTAGLLDQTRSHPLRDLRPGLRRPDRLAARTAGSAGHHRHRHPEWQRL